MRVPWHHVRDDREPESRLRGLVHEGGWSDRTARRCRAAENKLDRPNRLHRASAVRSTTRNEGDGCFQRTYTDGSLVPFVRAQSTDKPQQNVVPSSSVRSTGGRPDNCVEKSQAPARGAPRWADSGRPSIPGDTRNGFCQPAAHATAGTVFWIAIKARRTRRWTLGRSAQDGSLPSR